MQKIISKKKIRTVAAVLYVVEQRAVTLLLVALVILVFSYIYFLGSAVVYVVERKEVQRTIANVSSRIATLEVEYFKQKSIVTESLAEEMDFKPIAQKDFVDRTRYLGRAGVQ
ncbi:hypothetical protein CL644_00095 [bacterium]|jgi:hypothetical protein|nr:hypothetical protein [bacterium]|tara:strand:+ start:984 stop:1322 length:339 start_codon:yes stop_codon:yes gene_type:complete